MKLRDKILADPRVRDLDDEGPSDAMRYGAKHDYWCGLKTGWVLEHDWTHSIHEATLSEILEELKRVVPCNRECCGGNGGPAL